MKIPTDAEIREAAQLVRAAAAGNPPPKAKLAWAGRILFAFEQSRRAAS